MPTEMLSLAGTVLLDRHSSRYIRIPKTRRPGTHLETCIRLKCIGVKAYITLVPSQAVHIECRPSCFQRSSNGLPYPTLPVLVQSFLEMNDKVSLNDVVDGSNVTEDWGVENLDLDGDTDTNWAHERNAAVRRAQGERSIPFGMVPTVPFRKRDIWESSVRTKKARLGWTMPETLFVTRFRLRCSSDPWLGPRDCS